MPTITADSIESEQFLKVPLDTASPGQCLLIMAGIAVFRLVADDNNWTTVDLKFNIGPHLDARYDVSPRRTKVVVMGGLNRIFDDNAACHPGWAVNKIGAAYDPLSQKVLVKAQVAVREKANCLSRVGCTVFVVAKERKLK